MRLRFACLALLAAVLAACTNRPVAELRPLDTQFVLETADHWRSLAAEVADAAASAVTRRVAAVGVGYMLDDTPNNGEPVPVHVVTPDPRVPFGRSIAMMVENQLHLRGVRTTETAGRAAVLTLDWQTLPRSGAGVKSVPGPTSAAGAFSGLGYGAASADGIPPTIGALAGVALLADILAVVDATPRSEVVFAAELSVEGQTVMTMQRQFYVREADLAEYRREGGFAESRPVAPPMGPTPALRTFAVAGD